ncbi:LamG domain-containing protein, partial [Planctomycetota bacterium]
AIDEFRIWNIARSPEEIQAAMNSPLAGKEEGLVVYLNFDNGTAKDLSGHGNDGLLNADARIVESPYPVSLEALGEKPSKLVAWWKFDNDANDSAGANHGTTQGNPTYVDGKVGRAISLDGDDYVDCGNPDLLNFATGDWTLSAWIKTTQTGTDEDDEHKNRGTIFANGGDQEGGIRYALIVNETILDRIVLVTDDDTAKIMATARTVVNDGAWHHVVGMRKAGQLHVYIDGVLDGSGYLSAGYDLSGTSQHNAYIGVITDNRDNSLFKHFVGLIDEVCIFGGAIDANGVRALYSGEDPMTVAQMAIIAQAAVAEPQARTQREAGGPRGSIEGDWQAISDQVSQKAVIEIRRESDGTLSGVIVAESAEAPAIPLNNVTFENGKLRFEMPSDQGALEGTMKEDGLTIEGQFQQQGQMVAIVLKRVDAAPSEAAPASQEQFQDRRSGTSNIAMALILILALAGVVAGIVFFLVKSSVRR